MKILMVVHNFPPAFIGGTERAAELLAVELARRGHELLIFSGASDPVSEACLEEEEHAGLSVRRFRRSEDFRSPVDPHDPECEAFLENTIREFQPDLVHVHHWAHLSMGLVALARRCGARTVVTLHDYWTTCSLFFRLPEEDQFCDKPESHEHCMPCLRRHRPMEEGELSACLDMRFRSILNELSCSDAILISGRRQLEMMASFSRFPRDIFEKVHLLPIGVVPADFLVKKKVAATADQRLVVGHWGNLSRMKGLEILVRAAAQSPHARGLHIKLIGEIKDGNLRAGLHEMAGAARIQLHGRYAAEELPELIADIDVAVFPSLCEETHSIVLDEALLAGLPVIVSDRGAMAGRVGGRGLVVPADDVDALSHALDEMADDTKRAAFAEAPCGDLVDAATYAAQVEELYESLPQPDPRRPVVDLGRDRLVLRQRRFFEVGRLALAEQRQRRNMEAALLGDEDALVELGRDNQDLAERIASFLRTRREEHHDD